MSTEDALRHAAAAMGWDEAATAAAKATVMEGGATGETFLLTAGNGTKYAVRLLPDGRNKSGFIRAAKALGGAGVAPQVVAASDDVVVSAFVDGAAPVTVAQLCDGTEAVARVARLTARLHSTATEDVGEACAHADNELAKWVAKADTWLTADMRTAFTTWCEDGTPAALGGPAAATVTTHGDLHPGNILLGQAAGKAAEDAGEGGKKEEEDEGEAAAQVAVLVDLEHVAPRCAASDIAYLFAVSGDLRYTIGFAPSADAPIPYLPLEQRRAFVEAYLEAMTGAAPTADAVTEMLFHIEVQGVQERARLLAIWVLLSKGAGMLFGGATAYLPHVKHARAAIAKAAGGDSDLKRAIVEHGAVVVGARSATKSS